MWGLQAGSLHTWKTDTEPTLTQPPRHPDVVWGGPETPKCLSADFVYIKLIKNIQELGFWKAVFICQPTQIACRIAYLGCEQFQ